MFSRKGIILILSAASGSGKSSIAKALCDSDIGITVSMSATTRKRREYEEDGKHYQFISEDKFKDMIANNEFLEYAHVFGNYYGTPKSEVENKIEKGEDVILDIDWQGANKVAQKYSNNAVGVFILPPSREELAKRLTSRGDNKDIIDYRMSEAKEQISHIGFFDYVVVNYNFEQALEEIKSIIKAERLKQSRLLQVRKFIDNF